MRRPPLLIAAGATAIVLGALLVLVLGPPGRLGPVPLSDNSPSPSPSPDLLLPAGQRAVIPVLLVHGYAGAPSQMEQLAERLQRSGRTVSIVELPKRGTVDIHLSALTVDLAARDLHAPLIDVVGYSLGGVAARQALLAHDPKVHVRRMVLLATPNNGVHLPDDSGKPEQKHCEPGNACGELAPDSPFLKALNASPEAKGRKGWLTVASETDRLVHPPSVVSLKGAQNLVLQTVCPGATADHGDMDDAPPILGLVSLFLDARMPSDPTCAEAMGAA